MTDSIGPRTAEVDQQQLAQELVESAVARGGAARSDRDVDRVHEDDPSEPALEAEMADHLGNEPHHRPWHHSGNSCDGSRVKTVTTETGAVDIEVPQDWDGSFEPQLIKKQEARLSTIEPDRARLDCPWADHRRARRKWRIIPTRKGFVQRYNAQVAVTTDQMIVAVQVGQSTNDQGCFAPMMRAVQNAASRIHATTNNTEHVIGTLLADAGYNTETNLTAAGCPDRLIALGKGRGQALAAAGEPAHGPPPAEATPRHANGRRLRTPRRPNLIQATQARRLNQE